MTQVDRWQGGAQWVGPTPTLGSGLRYAVEGTRPDGTRWVLGWLEVVAGMWVYWCVPDPRDEAYTVGEGEAKEEAAARRIVEAVLDHWCPGDAVPREGG